MAVLERESLCVSDSERQDIWQSAVHALVAWGWHAWVCCDMSCVSRLLHMYVRFVVFVYGALLLAPADNMHGDAACAPFFFLVRQAQPKHRLFLDD